MSHSTDNNSDEGIQCCTLYVQCTHRIILQYGMLPYILIQEFYGGWSIAHNTWLLGVRGRKADSGTCLLNPIREAVSQKLTAGAGPVWSIAGSRHALQVRCGGFLHSSHRRLPTPVPKGNIETTSIRHRCRFLVVHMSLSTQK